MFFAIVKTTDDGRIAKYRDFNSREEAEAHVEKYGGMVFEAPEKTPWNDILVTDGKASISPPPPPPIKVPASVTMAQARLALAGAGLLATIQAGLEALPEPERTKAMTAWEYSPNVSRNGTLVTTLAGSFDITDSQLDALFIAAAAIEL